jgi:catechol 2,3-dioxygenase-like lactoylglutathione lyase family enzyme
MFHWLGRIKSKLEIIHDFFWRDLRKKNSAKLIFDIMKIKRLTLFVEDPKACADFYATVLGFETFQSEGDFIVKMLWSELVFRECGEKYIYHYCFIIPKNQFENALNWAMDKIELIEIEKGKFTQFFDDWNAESFYFHDAMGNLAEFIVHYDIESESEGDFGAEMVLGISEIGLPTLNISDVNDQLIQNLGSQFWKGDMDRFGTHGSPEGKILLPNYQVKDTWFPSGQPIQPAPFEAILQVDDREFNLSHDGGDLKFS